MNGSYIFPIRYFKLIGILLLLSQHYFSKPLTTLFHSICFRYRAKRVRQIKTVGRMGTFWQIYARRDLSVPEINSSLTKCFRACGASNYAYRNTAHAKNTVFIGSKEERTESPTASVPPASNNKSLIVSTGHHVSSIDPN